MTKLSCDLLCAGTLSLSFSLSLSLSLLFFLSLATRSASVQLFDADSQKSQDAVEEYNERYELSEKFYKYHIALKWRTEGKTLIPPPKLPAQEKTFRPESCYIRAPHFRTFKKYLKANKFHYSQNTSPKYCPICKKGPVNEVLLASMLATRDKATKAGQKLDAQEDKLLEKLRLKVAELELHKAQLVEARKVAYEIRDYMKVGEVFVTRDYVNHNDHEGGHVKSLILVLQWRDKDGGPMLLKKIRNFCSDPKTCSTDAYFTRDVMDFHLSKKGY